MTIPSLTPDTLLTTTRTVRKRLDLDRAVPLDLVAECLEIALQAPSGSNRQSWQWIVITDDEQRRAIGDIYRRAVARYLDSSRSAGKLFADDPQRSASNNGWPTVSRGWANTWVKFPYRSFRA